MSEGPMYPPPGAPPPQEPAAGSGHPAPGAAPPGTPALPPFGTTAPPGWAPYPTTPGGPRPGMVLGAAHKPGAFALRPLGLGDMYDGAFRIIRFNPRATVGAAVLVTAAAMLIPLLITAVLSLHRRPGDGRLRRRRAGPEHRRRAGPAGGVRLAVRIAGAGPDRDHPGDRDGRARHPRRRGRAQSSPWPRPGRRRTGGAGACSDW
ncbi:hypothetical protein G5V59_11175 [Nocardioides sp. W3-2-3]|uniref:hypothetical protein n=1 Tax=Nocardioides convexus TaxID=2712224 RepID=UPI0024183FD5|nr:hypothetical protein [Nocardioides convexus]NHA00434.1 hypothetical protein [Nocardioides convexus]